MMLALASGSFSLAAREPADGAPRSSLIDTRDRTRIHFRDWGAGRPIVFVAPWGLCSDWWDIPVMSFNERKAVGSILVYDQLAAGDEFVSSANLCAQINVEIGIKLLHCNEFPQAIALPNPQLV